jgi:hypothetical protein
VSRVVSLPREHGGYLTLVGGVVAALLLSPRPGVALACAVAIVAAFFARGPLERERLAGAWDPALLGLLAAAAVVAYAAAIWRAGWAAVPAVLLPPSMVGAAWAARKSRLHRSRAFELAGMAALGASTGLIVFGGGASGRVAAILALVLGTHAATAVPLVRSELRPRERARAASDAWLTLALLASAAVLLLRLSAPLALAAFAPRLLQLALRLARGPVAANAVTVGLRETAALTLTVALAVITLWR